METKFEIKHQLLNGVNLLTFVPLTPCGYEPKTIEVTQEQWDALRYHFATGVNDKTGGSILAYVS